MSTLPIEVQKTDQSKALPFEGGEDGAGQVGVSAAAAGAKRYQATPKLMPELTADAAAQQAQHSTAQRFRAAHGEALAASPHRAYQISRK